MSNQFAPYQQQSPGFPQEQRPSGSGCLWGVLIGCGGLLLVSVMVCVGLMWWVQQNAGKLAVGLAREVIVASINASEIPDGEKIEVIAQVDRVVNEFKAGRIDEKDLERLMQVFETSPAFLMISAWGLETSYLEPSGLSDEEKKQGRRTIQRAFRGLCEKKITQQQFQEVVPEGDFEAEMEAADGDVPKAPQPRATPLTDDEVRQLLADLKKLADDAGIPDEPFTIDIGDEVKKAVDEALKGEDAP